MWPCDSAMSLPGNDVTLHDSNIAAQSSCCTLTFFCYVFFCSLAPVMLISWIIILSSLSSFCLSRLDCDKVLSVWLLILNEYNVDFWSVSEYFSTPISVWLSFALLPLCYFSVWKNGSISCYKSSPSLRKDNVIVLIAVGFKNAFIAVILLSGFFITFQQGTQDGTCSGNNIRLYPSLARW